MARFVLRNTTGGSALRDGNVLQEPTGNLYVDALADTLRFVTTGETLLDSDGQPILDSSGNPILTTPPGDRLAHPEVLAEVVTFATTTGGGTAYIVSVANTVAFTTTGGDTFGSGSANAFTHSWADALILTTSLVELFNLSVVPLLPAAVEPWGRSQRWNAWVEFLVAGQVVASSAVDDFTLLGGRITEDLSRSILADVTLELGFPTGSPFIPTELGDLLDPHGETVIRVWAGYLGHEVPMGLFDLATTPLNLTPGGLQVSVTGMSFERVLQRAGFWTVENFGAGYQTVHAVARLVRQVIVDQPIGFEANGAVIPEVTWKPGDDRLAKITEMAEAASMEARFNRIGHFWLYNAPTSADFGKANPVWEFLDGRNATLLDGAREFSDAESFNGVVIEGTGDRGDTSEPIYHTEWIQDPSSPLYFNPTTGISTSRWGPRPKHIRTDLVSTADQAAAMARSELAKLLVVSDSVAVQAPANAALEVGQYARLRASTLAVDETYRIVRVVHDLAGGPVDVTLYRNKVV